MHETNNEPPTGGNGDLTGPSDGPPPDEILIRVAWYYYKDGLTQAQIAERVGVSRASVGRHLDRARESGLVQIDIEPRALRSFQLSRSLCAAFGLRDAVVVPDLAMPTPPTQVATNARLADGAAQYLAGLLTPGTSLGIGYGDTVARTLSACRPALFDEVTLVTLTGGINAYLFTIDGLRSDGLLSTATATRIIPTPIVVSSPELAAALRSDRSVGDLLAEAATVDLAVTGIGNTDPEATLVQWGYQDPDELKQLEQEGMIGDILGMFYDAEGRFRESELSSRRIGIGPDEFAAIPTKIGVAGGSAKLAAIHAALRGGLLDVLITTESVTHALLAEVGATDASRASVPASD